VSARSRILQFELRFATTSEQTTLSRYANNAEPMESDILSFYGGYTNAAGTPTPKMLDEITFVDDSIGQMVNELDRNGLLGSTLIMRILFNRCEPSQVRPTLLSSPPAQGNNDGGNSVLVFDASAQDDAAPIRVLKGPASLVSNPTGCFSGQEKQ